MDLTPSMDAPPHRRSRRVVGWILPLALVAAVFAWNQGLVPCERLAAQPSCKVSMLPGPSEEVDDLVEIGDGPATYGSDGELVLTTVLVDSSLNALEFVRDSFDGDVALLDRSQVYPSGQTVEESRVENQVLMSDSQLVAKVAALNHLGVDLERLTAGAELVSVLDDTPAAGAELEPGDVVTAVDGAPVDTADEAVQALAAFSPGDEVVLTLDEDPARDVDLTLAANPDDPERAYVGVMLRDFQVLPYDISIDAGNIGGPSAGLMFSLGIVDRLTETDLTGGHRIAGTGTIAADGRVGAIAGVVQKIVGAVEADHPPELFLVPDRNWNQAITARPDAPVTLVRVVTLDEAVEALEAFAAEERLAGAVVVGPDGVSNAG